MILLLTPTIYSTINLLNTFDNKNITLCVTQVQPCCHLFSCTCRSCSVASFILIMLLWSQLADILFHKYKPSTTLWDVQFH